MLEPCWRPGGLVDVFGVAEQVAARDLNNLYRASCYFEDPERYRAFCAKYAVMRVVDDRVDAIPARAELSSRERQQEHAVVDAWNLVVDRVSASKPVAATVLAGTDHPQAEALTQAIATAFRRFRAPPHLWGNFFNAMHRDIERPRFETYDEFVRYAEGATVAPTTIYLYLITAELTADRSRYEAVATFDLVATGRSLGLFAYLGHILRDLAQDLATGREGLLYIAGEDLERHGLDEARLFHDLQRRSASPALRGLVLDLVARARGYLSHGRELLTPLEGRLPPDRRFVLELILAIYEGLLDRIELCEGDVMAGHHRLSDGEKQAIALSLVRRISDSAGSGTMKSAPEGIPPRPSGLGPPAGRV